MSQLLDALRRANRASSFRREPEGASPSGDVVLRALGRSRSPRGRSALPIVALVGLVAIVGAVIWSAVQRASPPAVGSSWQEPAPRAIPSSPSPPDPVPPGDRGGVPVTADPTAPVHPEPAPEPRLDISVRASSREVRGTTSRPRRTAPQPSGTPTDAYDEFERAAGLQQAGDHEAAVSAYHALLRRGRLTAEVHNNLGLLLQSRGLIAEAERHFAEAIASRPGYAAAHNNLGVLLLASGRPGAAEASFRRAAGLDARDPDALVNLALAQKAGGRRERARESLLQALSLAPRSAPAHYNLAVLSEGAGETGRAVEHYQAFLECAGPEHREHVAIAQSRLDALQRVQ